MGYVKKRSVPSLLAGVAFGALYGYSGFLISENNEAGHDLATGMIGHYHALTNLIFCILADMYLQKVHVAEVLGCR